MHRLNPLATACLTILTACAGHSVQVAAPPEVAERVSTAADLGPAERQPEGWADELALTIPEDLNPDPDILEIELEAKVTPMEIVPGYMTPVWSYGGSLPGPLIRGKVGDRVIVHFRNSLPEATSIHWHGLRVPNAMDGAPGTTQAPIESGGEFTYDFILRDAGTYWYHPHLDSAAQVGWGLYGPIVVDDPAEQGKFGDELVLMLSDMSLDEEGQFLPVNSGGAFSDLFGREGRILLVNGKVTPTLKARQGLQQRWRIINAARTRYYTLRPGRGAFVRLGGDNGLAERSERVREIMLVPGERADAVFTPGDPPGSTPVYWHPTERGYGTTYSRLPEKMLTLETADAPPVTPRVIPDFLRPIPRVDPAGAREEHVDFTIGKTEDGSVVMGINGIEGAHHSRPGEVNIEARIGETQVWRLTNGTDFSHPFHLHGYFFQVLDDHRVPEWKDTVDIPAKSELRIVVRFDERPGDWMFHCHILDHAELGMMGTLRVNP